MNKYSQLTNEIIDAGITSLDKYTFVSTGLNSLKSQLNNPSAPLTVTTTNNEPFKDKEKPVTFRMNTTGNIYYASTSDKIKDETRDLFNSVSVLFSAMTTAMTNAKKSLFDYDSWSKMIGSSGYFVEVSKFKSTIIIKKNQLSINTQIIQRLIPGLTTGNSLEIAKNVLEALNGEYKNSKTKADEKLGHLLFICEELFGAPSVHVRLFYGSKKSHSSILKTPCVSTAKEEFNQVQEANTFMFVDPDIIAQFASKFQKQPKEYEDLIKKLESSLQTK
ncbi:MAG: Zygote formation protein zyg1 [Bacteroidota bacterium]